ncbi:MAG: amino acid ABC transporter permease [Thermoanaerobacterales bacterium]|nr:amino acid ABC transporter permease [Thermoanaerobacterales bacterium]
MTATDVLAEPIGAPEPEPPRRDLTPRQWVRANLFSSPLNSVLTVVIGLGTAYVVYRLARWAFVTAEWAVVRVNLRLFMVGFFPVDQLWRLWVALYVLVATCGLAAGALAEASRRVADGDEEPAPRPSLPRRVLAALHRFWPAVVCVAVILGFTRTPGPTVGTVGLVVVGALAGAAGRRVPRPLQRWAWVLPIAGLVAALQVIVAGEDGVGWDRWGGLHLAVAATIAGVGLAFPLGLLLALGRRSSLRALRLVSIAYIEAFRAVPLVTLLFLGGYMVGYLFPNTVEPPSFLVRAVIAITLFEAAYIAEIVRGGLQAVPRGQYEAAQALGLSPVGVMRLVVLPQALRAVIPAMVGQFISLFKDTSLLTIIGFLELIEVTRIVTQQDAFRGQGLRPIALAFVGLIYWAGCSTMSRESQRLERRLGVGER